MALYDVGAIQGTEEFLLISSPQVEDHSGAGRLILQGRLSYWRAFRFKASKRAQAMDGYLVTDGKSTEKVLVKDCYCLSGRLLIWFCGYKGN